MIKNCIFDLDGTLLNTLPTIAYYGNYTLEKFGLESLPVDNYRYYCGNGAKVLIERIMKDAHAKQSMYDEIFEFYNNAYNADTAYLTKPYDGICEMLEKLKAAGVKTAVLSNKPDYAAKGAVKNFLGDLIDIVHGGRDGVPLKPNPKGINDLLAELNAKREECLYIGDTDVDMQTGKNAGIYTIGVLWGFRTKDELFCGGADMLADSPNEIADAVFNFAK